MHAQRGQTLLETALFLPLMLLGMFGIIYFSQYGVLQERSLQGARFASLVTDGSSTDGFSLEKLYHELHREGNNAKDPGLPEDVQNCAATAGSDGANGLTQAETLPGGGVGATAPPYFQPDSTSSVGTCAGQSLSLGTTDQDAANWYFGAHLTNVQATKSAPYWIQKLTGSSGGQIRGAMLNLRAAPPDHILYCSPGFAQAIANGLGAVEPEPLAGPFAGYATPPPSAPHVC